MGKQELKKWEPEAWKVAEPFEKLPLPFHVLAGEALDVLRFCQRNWQSSTSSDGQIMLPGLSAAVGNGLFTEKITVELEELIHAFQAAQSQYHLLSGPGSGPMERALFVWGELQSTLEWLFDDGKITEEDAQLETLAAAHRDAMSHDAVAAALYDYAELAERHQSALKGLGGFDLKLIAEARALGLALREQSAGPAKVAPLEGQKKALELRNRLATLVYDRMQIVRNAVRFIYRHHPRIVREVTSAYGRAQRAAHRRAVNAEAPATPGAPTAPTPPVGTAPAPVVPVPVAPAAPATPTT